MHNVRGYDKEYPRSVPKLWKDTVAEHRRDVRAAILDATWQLAAERGVLAVTMGQVAKQAGIGRATLYKYFGGVEQILVAAHTEHVNDHLTRLESARASAHSPADGLSQVLNGYARICFHRAKSAAPDLHGLLHSGEEYQRSQQQLLALFAVVLREAQHSGAARTDVNAEELAAYCVHALAAAAVAPSQAALDRLVGVVEAGLRASVS